MERAPSGFGRRPLGRNGGCHVIVKVALFAALGACSSALYASQDIPQGQDVADRPHPDYAQVGIDVGGFTLLPSLTTTAAATDNYRAARVDRKANASLLLRPDLTWHSDWARHRIDGDLFVEQRLNAPLQHENVTSYGASANALYDFSRETRLRVSGAVKRLAEDRTKLNSFQAAVEPVRYDVLHGDGTFSKSFGQLELQGTASFDKLDYRDAKLSDGQSISQDFRDYRSIAIGGSAEYDLANGIGLIATARRFDNDYDFGPGSAGFVEGVSLDRDSVGLTAEAGVTLELSNLIFGTIQAGYLTRNYKDPRIHDISSPSFTANILWNVTPLTSLIGTARRWIEESSSTVSAGNVRSDFDLEVHHELYRHVLLTGEAGLSRFKPVSIGSMGTEYSGLLGARYLLSRRATINSQVRYSRRDSNNLLLRYHATEFRLSFHYGI
jgi:hypothetical protein